MDSELIARQLLLDSWKLKEKAPADVSKVASFGKLCVSKFSVGKLCVGKLCVDKLCVGQL